MELFLSSIHRRATSQREATVVQLKYMGKAYQASMSNAYRL